MKIRPNDLVEVKTPDEILETLDAEGTLDFLPFMPEMIESCGKRFRVSRRAFKTCVSGSGPSTIRAFKNDGVIILDGLRCSGAAHDVCQKESRNPTVNIKWIPKARNGCDPGSRPRPAQRLISVRPVKY